MIDATATDGDGVVTKVEFYQGTTLLGSDTSAPYTFAWNNVSGGVYSITAKATDDNGAVTTSSAITVNVLDSLTFHSLSLNGTSGYVTVPNSSSINISGPITIEAWIKVNAITGNYQDIVCRESWAQAGTGGGYEFAITSTGKVRLDLYQSHNQYTTAIGSTTVTANTWHHVAGVFDGSQMRVYLNGVLDGSLSTTNGPASGTSPLNIGKSTYTTYYFGGLIDEVRISAAALYSANFTPGLGPANQTRAFWKFDGQTANDSSGNGNHGTLQSGATYSTSVPAQGGSQRPVPTAGGPYNGQLAQSVQFSSSGSFDPDGTITGYHWNFGDGTSSNAANPTHTYQSSGLFTATLTVTDNSGLLASATALVSINGSSESRLDPKNATGGSGENPLSRNFNWTLPLVSLPGRTGLDLNLTLSYNSLVWTKKGTTLISFDDDYGFPSPGFRLGFPTIQTEYLNSETGKWSYLLIESDGSRTDLRRVTNSTVLYESADSSHLLLDTTDLASSDPKMVLKTTDGTQLTYKPKGGAYQCTEIKDRNGNYITINYNAAGRIANIHDTLDRTITFVYENDSLKSIEQQWKKPSNPSQTITHTWASFAYTNVPIQTNFASGLTVNGPNGSSVKMLSKITIDDNSTTPAENSHYDFEYTSWGQVWKISNFAADNHILNYRSYKLPGSPLWTNPPAQSDCPRFTERRDWAENWNENGSGVEQEAVTTFTEAQSGTASVPGSSQNASFVQVTNPDQTFTKIYFLGTAGSDTGWRVGLPYLVESYDVGGTIAQRQVATTWTQDDVTNSYILNPRVAETNIYDPSGNRKRTDIQYHSYALGNGMSCQLPQDVRQYAADADTILRTTRAIYVDDSAYLSRRIIGLPKESMLYEGAVSAWNLRAKREFIYDESGSIDGNDTPVQYDPAYSSIVVRGNLSTVKRFDVTNLPNSTTAKMKYNKAGSLVSSKDALDNETKISYTDSFSDGVSRNTLAYPTKLTDPDGYYSTSKYNFDFGALTYRQTPPPNDTTQPNPSPTPVGPGQSFTYDDLGRLERTTSLVNNAYTRYQYPANKIRLETFSTLVVNKGEAYSFRILDGFRRTIASASAHPSTPGTSARFDAHRTAYDIMGRVIKSSNPAETSAIGDNPAQWQLVEGDLGSNWQALFTHYTYDWKGRPKITTNTDGTTKSVTYEGCGCAGGEVVTLNDEGTIVNGVTKTRQQKIYSDVLGRTVKSEVWNFDGTGPGGVGRALYATTVTNYNARDQVTLIRQFKGAAPANYLTDLSCPTGTCQKTEFTYDGYGRLQTKHVPEQRQNPYVVTSWTYNADDTLNTITDGRGAVTEYGYGTSGNNRRLVKTISHTLSGSLPITLSFDYDAAGNRKSMSHSINGSPQDSCDYTYDQLSRLTSETRHVNALANSATSGNYTIGYQYALGGQLSSVTDPFGSTTNLNYDAVGRTESVTGSYAGVNYTYANDIEYRAWGAVKRHGVKTITYNNRMQATQFRYFQYRYDYNYHPDGQLKHLTDLDDVVGQPSQVTFHYMSRDYGYDHAGRLSRVDATNNPIVNGGLVPAPFVGNYGYDEFNNLNSRSGYYALNPSTSDSATFVDNKRTNTGWSYDAVGRVLTSVDTATGTSQTWSYDAAGRNIGISEVSSGSTSTSTLSYDGDGKLLYNSVTTPQSTKADYLIWSTVLGSVLTKLDASGNKDITYVPANGLAFPMQTKDFNGNPSVGGVWRDVTGLQEDGKAVDPFGARIHNVQPPTSGSPPAIPFYGVSYANTIWSQLNVVNNSTGCVLDGQRVDCNTVKQRYNDGLVQLENIHTADGHVKPPPGLFDYYVGERGFSMFITGSVFSEPEPQNTSQIFPPIDLDKLKGLIHDRLKYGDCADYVAKLINKAAELSNGSNPAVGTNILDTFEKVRNQRNGGIIFAPPDPSVSGGGGTADGNYRNDSLLIKITRLGYFRDNPRGAYSIPFRYGHTGLHELIHASGQINRYTEAELTRAARELEPSEEYLDWDYALKKHCLPPEGDK